MGEPYYKDESVTLYLGDCREIIPSLPVSDLLCTDPPYGVNWQSGWGHNHDKIIGDDGSLPFPMWLPAALGGLREWRHAYIFGFGISDIPSGSPIGGASELIWDKGIIGPGDLSSPWGPMHERILFGVHIKSKKQREMGRGNLAARLRKGSVIRIQRGQGAQTLAHPTEKPVMLMRILIESSSTFGETVLDPFAGSGSTLVAAVLEGRKAIGVEIDEKYAEHAANRLRAVPRA